VSAWVLDTLKDAVVIPAEAVQQGAGGSFLFVGKDDGTVEVRKVRIASIQQEFAIVAEGLTAVKPSSRRVTCA
jgi:multidrug efflux system membrane fusion protein